MFAQKKEKKNSRVSLRTLETENVVTSPLTGQACLPVFEYLSSIDSFARSEDINLTALNFATKKQEGSQKKNRNLQLYLIPLLRYDMSHIKKKQKEKIRKLS